MNLQLCLPNWTNWSTRHRSSLSSKIRVPFKWKQCLTKILEKVSMWNRKWSSRSFLSAKLRISIKPYTSNSAWDQQFKEPLKWVHIVKGRKWWKEKEGAFQVLAIDNIESQGPHTCCFETRFHTNPHHTQLTNGTSPWFKILCKLSNFKLSQLVVSQCPVLLLGTVAPHFLFQSATKSHNFWRNRTRVVSRNCVVE